MRSTRLDVWEQFSGTYTAPKDEREHFAIHLYNVNSRDIAWFDDLQIGQADMDVAPEGVYACRKVAQTPEIDGLLGGSAWGSADRAEGFSLPGREAPMPVVPQTEFHAVYDEQFIYFAVTAYDPDPSRLVQNVQVSDGRCYSDDCIEIFLDTNGDRNSYCHFVINSCGVDYDAYRAPDAPTPGDSTWNGSIQSKTKVDKDRWTLETAIALRSLSAKPRLRDRRRFNVARNFPRYAQISTCAVFPPPHRGFHSPDQFVELQFGSAEVPEEPRRVSRYNHASGSGLLLNPDFSRQITLNSFLPIRHLSAIMRLGKDAKARLLNRKSKIKFLSV